MWKYRWNKSTKAAIQSRRYKHYIQFKFDQEILQFWRKALIQSNGYKAYIQFKFRLRRVYKAYIQFKFRWRWVFLSNVEVFFLS